MSTVTVRQNHCFHVGDTIFISNPDTRWWMIIYCFIRYSELPPAIKTYFKITGDVTSTSFTFGEIK